MINQDKVRQMSRLAMLESDMGKEGAKICSYKCVDFVLMQILKGFFAGTICFAALAVLGLGFIWDDLNLIFADAQFEAFFISVLKTYAIFLIIYLVICVIVAVFRYKKGKKRASIYLSYLKDLEGSYTVDETAGE